MTGEGRDGMEELIPENSTLAQRIRAAASKGTLSHAAILSGSGGPPEEKRKKPEKFWNPCLLLKLFLL